ncbi:GNAT family N-acetyltransferase [Metabacillus malikii]|uniref:RimJ/RimL family protein N-acetyltransferase n=1 Tax=Metabacillus malikii TaxID=1504265 RepID=A0ABT9ZA68_9BACI|nr:GNAT family N-acetyltransferase [Metabacillus malikii]MDQ0229133.1 RimJ/RimL family protein N-acetyltransferase [Metabacillus malikii]
MIIELERSEFYKCKPLLFEQGSLEPKAVVEGVNPGRIFVDDLVTPTTGLIWLGNNDGFYFIGNEHNEAFNNELNQFVDTVIIPEARKVGLAWFEGIGHHPKWDDVIQKVFGNRLLGSWNQKVYMLETTDWKVDIDPDIEAGYQIVRIDESLLKNNDTFKNIEFLDFKIRECWETVEEFFLNGGIGYCAVYKNEIVSVCLSSFIVDDVHCIDIETLNEHQGKKLAQTLAKSFVKECLANNKIPYWDCMELNKPSIAVAEKVGFKNVLNYKGYDFML